VLKLAFTVQFGETVSYGDTLYNTGCQTNDLGFPLSGLAPNTTYFYNVQSSFDSSTWSAGVTGSFTTAALPFDAARAATGERFVDADVSERLRLPYRDGGGELRVTIAEWPDLGSGDQSAHQWNRHHYSGGNDMPDTQFP